MSRRRSSPAGNYYQFVYEDDDANDDVDDDVSDQYPISPVEDLQSQQQMCACVKVLTVEIISFYFTGEALASIDPKD